MDGSEASLLRIHSLPPREEDFLDNQFPEYHHTMQDTIEVTGKPTVHLRHIAYDDAEALLRVIERNRDNLATYLGWTAKADIDAMLMRLMLMLDQAERDEAMAYCIVRGIPDDPGEVIGLNRLFDRYPSWLVGEEEQDLTGPVAHCGFWLDKNARGQGIIPRTCDALFQYAQKRWGIESIFMDVGKGNAPAEHCVRAMGSIATRIAPWETKRGDIIDLKLSHLDSTDKYPNSTQDMSFAIGHRKRVAEIKTINTIAMQKWLLGLNSRH